MKHFITVLLIFVYSLGFCTKVVLGHGESIEGKVISANTQEIYLLFNENKLAIINKKTNSWRFIYLNT